MVIKAVSTPFALHKLITKNSRPDKAVLSWEFIEQCLRVLLLSLFIPVFGITNAQSPEWVMAKAMGGADEDAGNSIALDASGNIYSTGRFEGTVDFDPGGGFELTSEGSADIFISKLDGSGNFEWAVSMGGTEWDEGHSIALDASGNVYTTGRFSGTVDFDPGAGVFILTSAGNYDMFITKFDNAGNFIWVKAISDTPWEQGLSIAVDASGNIYTTGVFSFTIDFDPGPGVFNLSSAGAEEIFVLKLDASGNFVWAKAMGGEWADYGYSIAVSASGNVYTTGQFFFTSDFDPGAGVYSLTSQGNSDIFISKLDASGNFVWAGAIGGAGFDFGLSIALDASENVYTTGWFNGAPDFDPGAGTFNLSSAGASDIFILKLDISGNFEWAKGIGGTNEDHGYSIALDDDDNVYTTGYFRNTADFDPGAGTSDLTSAGFRDIFVSKLDESGDFVFALQAGGTGDERGNSITLDAFGNAFLTGYFASPFSTFGAFTLTSEGGPDIFIAKVGIGSGNPLDVSITSSTNVVCNGQNTGSATATATGGSPPYTYEWSNGGSGPTINNLVAGTYIVTVFDNNSGIATAGVTITQLPLLVLSPPSITNVSCDDGANGSIQAGATGGTAPYVFTWSNGSNGATISNLTAGAYTVTVTDDNDCTKEATYIVTQPEDIVISLIELVYETCAGDQDGSVTIEVMGGVNPISAEWSNGFSGLSIVDLAPDTYSVTVTDSNVCTETASYIIDPGVAINVSLLQMQNVSCHGGSNGVISLMSSEGNSPYTYTWSNGMDGPYITGLSADTYHVTVTDVNGCLALANYTIIEPTALAILISQTEQNLCFGDTTAFLEASVEGGTPVYTALWSDGTMGLINANLAAATYTVTVTDDNECTSTMSATITEPPQLTVSVSATNETAVGANDGTAAATAGGGTPGFSYLWSNGAITNTINGLPPGTYTVTITDMNACAVSGSGLVNAFGCMIDLQLGQNFSMCEGDTAIVTTLVAGATGSVTYLWTDGSTGDSLYVNNGGEYCVTVTDAAGCLDVECVTITEIIIPLLACPVTNESAPDANDGAVQCDSIPDIVAYVWSNGATTYSIVGLSPGEYCVTVTDVNGCTKTQCFNVQPANCQMIVASAQTDVSCHGDSTGSISLTVTGATEPVTYTWSNGDTSPAISNLIAGSYAVMVTDAAGCFDNQSFLIKESPAIHIMVDSIAPVQDFDSGLIWITVSGGIPPYSYHWLDPDGDSFSTEDINNLFSIGYYSLTVTDGAGCIAEVDSIFVDFDLAADLTAPFKALKVYPVPTDDVLFIDVEIHINEVLISGADGRHYKHMINPGSNKIDVSDLGPGWYLVKVSDGSIWYMARMLKL